MTGSELRIGVAIPTWNRPPGLERALRSVVSQTDQPDDVLVVNDAGVDVSLLTASYRARYIGMAKNGGNAAARNVLVAALPSVDVVVFLDDDDELDSRYVECARRAFQEDPRLGFGWPAQRLWLDTADGPKLQGQTVWQGPTTPGTLGWLKGRQTGASGLAVRRGVFARVGTFDEELRAAVDTDWLVRAGEERSKLLPGCWLDVHRLPEHDGVSTSFAARYRAYAGLLRKHEGTIRKEPVFHAQLLARAARLALAADEVEAARSLLLRSLNVCAKPTTAVTLAATFAPHAAKNYRRVVRARRFLGL